MGSSVWGKGKVGRRGILREASSNKYLTETLLSCFRMGKQEQGGGGISRHPLARTRWGKHWMKNRKIIRYLVHSEVPVSSGFLLGPTWKVSHSLFFQAHI